MRIFSIRLICISLALSLFPMLAFNQTNPQQTDWVLLAIGSEKQATLTESADIQVNARATPDPVSDQGKYWEVWVITVLVLLLVLAIGLIYLINKRLQREIVKRLHKDYELACSERHYESLFENSPVLFHSVDGAGKLLNVSKKWLETFGYQRQEVIGKHFPDFLTDHSKQLVMTEMIPDLLNFGSIENIGIQVLTKNGDPLEILMSASAAIGQDGEFRHSLVFLNNSTEQKKTGEALRQAKEEAENAIQTKDQFLANMSHEIRTPLTAIIGFSQILMNKMESLSLPLELISLLSNISQSGQELAELIDNLLEYSKINTHSSAVNLEAVNLEDLIGSVCHTNQTIAEENNVQFVSTIQAGVPKLIYSDKDKLGKILLNLINNAIKFSPKKRTVEFSVDYNEGQLVFIMKDQGDGIAEDTVPSIFEAFEQGDQNVTRKFGSSGLGLLIVKKYVEALRGSFKVQSHAGAGTTFSIQIPLAKAEGKFEKFIEPVGQQTFAKNNRVLVVEDNRLNQELIKSFLAEIDLEIELAENGLQGIEKIESLQPDLVLMDIRMPKMDGMEAIRLIRSRRQFDQIPVIALSADASSEKKQEALGQGFNDYLTKPFNLDDLVPYLNRYLRKEVPQPQAVRASSDQLPISIRLKISEEFQKLVTVPRSFSNELLDQIDAIRNLVQPFQTTLSSILQEIENAVYECDEEKLEQLIKEQAAVVAAE